MTGRAHGVWPLSGTLPIRKGAGRASKELLAGTGILCWSRLNPTANTLMLPANSIQFNSIETKSGYVLMLSLNNWEIIYQFFVAHVLTADSVAANLFSFFSVYNPWLELERRLRAWLSIQYHEGKANAFGKFQFRCWWLRLARRFLFILGLASLFLLW